ncbi:MAG: hypothetical protein V1918_02950 [Planctomycetota bacterium]
MFERTFRRLARLFRPSRGKEEALLTEIAAQHARRAWNPGARFEGDAGLALLSERGTAGLVQVKRDAAPEELPLLLDFVKHGGKLVCLPMYAGVPSERTAPLLLASGYTSNDPPPAIRSIPSLPLGDMDFHCALARSYPSTDGKRWDFVNSTWAGDIRHKRWDLALALAETLCERHTMALVVYKNRISPEDRARLRPWVERGNLTLFEEALPKEAFSDVLRHARVGIVHSEWDARPRYLDQLLLSDVPVLLNARIYGGQRLVEGGSGEIARPERLAECAREMLENIARYSGMRERYMERFGPYNAARRLTRFLNGLLRSRFRTLVPQGFVEFYLSDYIRRHAERWADPGEFFPDELPKTD